MTKIVIGFVLGVVVATIGFGGVARLLDRGVETVKTQAQDLAK